jgi:hypothetical protein
MLRNILAGLAATTTVMLTACATTSFHSTWRNPTAEPLNFRGEKVAAFILSEEEAIRYGAEEALAREITAHGAVGVPAYTLVPKELVGNEEKVRELLEKAEVVGVVALRPVARKQALTPTLATYRDSPYYLPPFWGPGFWGWGWGGAYDGYLRLDTILVVETLVYSVAQNRLVWASQSQTTNPSAVGSFIHELSNTVGTEMEKQGLLG